MFLKSCEKELTLLRNTYCVAQKKLWQSITNLPKFFLPKFLFYFDCPGPPSCTISSDISIQSANVLFVKHILDTYLPKFSTTKVLCSTPLVIKVVVNRKLQKIYTLKYIQSALLYYIVEQALCYYHSKFHSDTVFLRKDIVPNKYA